MKQILHFLKPYRRRIALAMALVAVSTVCDLLLPTIMSDILNRGILASDFAYIARCCAKMLLVAAIGLATLLIGRKLSTDIVAAFNGDLRTSIFTLVNCMTFEEFGRLGTAALVTRSTHDINTVSFVASLVSGSIVTIPVLFVGGTALAMWKDATLALILLAFVPLVMAVVFLVGHKIAPLYRESDKYIDVQNDIMRERLHGIRVIRAFNKEPREQRRIEDATRVMAENIINANVRMGLVSPVAVLILNLAVLLIVYVGGYRMENGLNAVSGGDIFAIIQYVALVTNGVLMASFAIVMFPHAQVAAERIGEVFSAKGMQEPNAEEAHTFSGNIVFDHVSFRYENAAEPAVSDICLSIEAGQKVAVIGGTGSGKSTLLQMLMAFRLPTEGRVLFDGVPAETVNRKVIRGNISCVLQRTAVYSGTIRQNIAMGRPGASEEEIHTAADIAQLSHYIAGLPEGMEHVLTQSGKNLSGGQKQRICIARAILKDAPIYVFDDSFSALDFLTEANLRRLLNKKIQGKTQIVITQRIASAMSADRIFVLDRGRLIDSGTHAELMQSCGIYREIYASQTGGEAR
ncbi:MAG: ABC transporter ATP-binding protein [Oscillospiraceae bacterium]|nr:ABC transporter ATP-binding protein [Oscillospiraceae bacterium]